MRIGQIIGYYGIRTDIAIALSNIPQGDRRTCEAYEFKFKNDPGISGRLYFRIEECLNKIARKAG